MFLLNDGDDARLEVASLKEQHASTHIIDCIRSAAIPGSTYITSAVHLSGVTDVITGPPRQSLSCRWSTVIPPQHLDILSTLSFNDLVFACWA